MTQADERPARVLLASQSPRRLQLLQQIALPCEVLRVDIDESRRLKEQASHYVQRLAREKAEAGRLHNAAASGRTLPVIGADTCVCLEDDVLGKPLDSRDAAATLHRLSGRDHQVMTAVALAHPEPDSAIAVRLSVSNVCFRSLTKEEIDAYCATGEPLDKAGSYAIQGRAAVFVSSMSGSYTGIVGLPLFQLDELLKELDISVWA